MSIRLIDTFTLSLQSFLGDIPPYAILSHTWREGEMTFQDMVAIGKNRHHSAAEKLGYTKVVATCRLASQRGIRYAWVDTCCIDKTSSAELSEVISSMYQWYWNAEICFVILTDIADATSLEIALPKCRWFTRGWCLQELIAPKSVEFYDLGWNYVGVKSSLTGLLSSITHIDEQVLVDRSQTEKYPVGRRMSWAAKRNTTRLEDIAYSLLGIFNVCMPMLYGEGPKAFMRLQQEIVKNSNDLSLFAFDSHPRRATGSYCDLFARSPEDFLACGSLQSLGTSMDAYTLTNRGLHFPRAKFQVDVRLQNYPLPLYCTLSNSTVARIYLQKVGPGLFAKFTCDDSQHINSAKELSEARTEIEEAYIVATISPSVRLQLESSGGYAVRVMSHGYRLSKALQVFRRVPLSIRWDTARMQFLTYGDRGVQAYWRLFPHLAQPEAGVKNIFGKASSPCNLLCGIQYQEDLSHPQAWVRLCSSEEWRRLEAEFGISITQGNDPTSPLDTGKTVDHITIDQRSTNPITIKAKISLVEGEGEEAPHFTLELEFNNPAVNQTGITMDI